RQTGTDPSPKRCKSPVAVHRRSACSGVKRCETQAPLRRHAAKLCYRFGPLTPSARSANLIAGDGAKNGSPAPNKEPTIHKQSPDSKSPIQVRMLDPARHRRLGEPGSAPPGRGASPSGPPCARSTARGERAVSSITQNAELYRTQLAVQSADGEHDAQ